MAQKLISQTDPELLQSGLAPGVHKLQAPLWVDGENVLFEDGSVKKTPGYVEIFQPVGSYPIVGMQDVSVGGTPNLIFGNIEKLYRWDGSSTTEEGTGYSGGLSRDALQYNAFQADAFQTTTDNTAYMWSMADWGSWVFSTNWIDTPQVNKMAGAGEANVGGTPPSYARIVRRYKTFIVFFSTDLGDRYAEWCDVDNPEDYVNGAAGNLFIRDLDSGINAVEPLGDVLAVYSNNSMAIFQYIGPDFWFGAKKVLTGIGATGIHAVIPREGMNYGISKSGIWETDGAQYNYISPPFLRDWIKNKVNFAQGDKINGMLNEDRNLLQWGLPINGSSEPNVTLTFNYQNRSFGIRNTTQKCGLRKNVFAFPIFAAGSGGYVLFDEFGVDYETYDGTKYETTSWVQSKPIDAGNAQAWKDIEYIIAHISSLAGTLNLYIGVQDDLDDAITWSSAIVMTEGSEPQFIDRSENLAGRYISFKLEDSDTGADWKFSGLEVFGVFTGMDI